MKTVNFLFSHHLFAFWFIYIGYWSDYALFVLVSYCCSVNSKVFKTNAQADFMVTLTKVMKSKPIYVVFPQWWLIKIIEYNHDSKTWLMRKQQRWYFCLGHTRNILNQKIWLEMFPFVLKASKCVWGKGAEFSSGLFLFIIGSLNSD